MNPIFCVIVADITAWLVDATVNAANVLLLGGAGMDGAIHHEAGPELLKARRTIGGCPRGEVRITPGFNLPVKQALSSNRLEFQETPQGNQSHYPKTNRRNGQSTVD